MTHHDFVSQIADTAPGFSDLVSLGLNGVSASKMISEYHVNRRDAEIEIPFATHDAIIDFIRCYNISNLKIGMVEFLAVPVNNGNYLHIAKVELDLMLLSISGEILVVDWQKFDHVMWRCAVNGEHFFEAMVIISQFLTLTMLNDEIYNDEGLALSVANTAAKAAGNGDYLSFYQMLLGV